MFCIFFLYFLIQINSAQANVSTNSPALVNKGEMRIAGADVEKLLAAAREKEIAGQTQEAANLYRQAVAREQENEVNAQRALAKFLSGNPATRNEAEQLYEKISLRAPDDVSIIVERATNLARASDSVKAIIYYRKAFEVAPDNEDAIIGYVNETAKIGATSIAIEQNSKALAKKPDNLAARLQLAELLRSDGHYNDALNHYWLVQKQAPDNNIALRGAGEAWLALGYTSFAEQSFKDLASRKNEKSISRFDRARLLLAQNRTIAALAALNADTAQSVDEKSLILIADVQRQLKNSNLERDALNRILETTQGKSIPALERLARIFFEANDQKAASALCERVLLLDVNNAIANFGLQLLGVSKLNAPPENLLANKSNVNLSDEAQAARRASAERALGEAALFWNKPQQAKIHLQNANVKWSRSPRVLSGLASALNQLKEFDAALAVYANVEIADDRQPTVILDSADIELARHNSPKALTLFRHVLRLEPTNLRALSGEAESLQSAENYEEAAAIYVELTRRAPEVEKFQANLISCLAQLGRDFIIAPAAKDDQTGQSNFQRNNLDSANETSSAVSVLLASGDKLRVQVAGKSRFDGEVIIAETGALKLPFLSTAINAHCLTEDELAAQIVKASRAGLTINDVKIQAVSYARAPLIIAGAVYLPNTFYVRTKLSLRQSLMLASGAKPDAGDVVYVVRGAKVCPSRSDAESIASHVETYLRAGIEERGVASQPLQAGDLMFVPDKTAVFIYGAVARPQVATAANNLTLLHLVKNVGGTLAGAERNRVKLTRLQQQGKTSQKFVIDLKDIEQNRLGDVILLPGDVVEIPAQPSTPNADSFAKVLRQAAAKDLSF